MKQFSVVIFFFALLCGVTGTKPNIIIFIADDMGWNDIGTRTKDLIYTPTLNSFMKDGINLNRYYTQDVCSPSRASILTGRYPSHYGLQHYVIFPQEPQGLPLNETTLPSLLKEAGYSTHAIGKWHQGFWKWDFTPTFRGFDTFYGYYNGGQDYYTHSVSGGYDFRRDNGPRCGQNCSIIDYDAKGKYSTHLFTKEAIDIINKHDESTPFYMYMSFQALHDPTEVPDSYVTRYEKTITNEKRRHFAGMVTCMDEGIGNITQALKDKGLYDNTIFLFTSDNGGPIHDATCNMCSDYAGSLNFPLRGGKHSLYEGGVRITGALAGNLVKQKAGTVYNGYIHTADLLPTLLEAVGVDVHRNSTDDMTYITIENHKHVLDLDGYSLWNDLVDTQEGVRDEIILNMDTTGFNGPMGGIIYKEWKLLVGDTGCPYSWQLEDMTIEKAQDLNKKATTGRQRELLKSMNYSEESRLQLFNVKEDPTEHNECMTDHPDVVEELLARLVRYMKTYVNPYVPSTDPNGAPSKHNNTWVPWGDL
ncbi:hypothetical protein WA158_004512 [Blastocystis sp. Blastoise]